MSIPSLKRPRSTSQPPSASSSPKRANSEDTAPSSDNGHQDLGLLTAMHQPPAAGSSPLRLDSEADETGWVKRTEDVHIGELDAKTDGDMDVEEGEDDSAAARYGQLLAALPPPFDLFKRYYIVPTEVLDTVKSLAHGGSGSKDAAQGSLPRLDLSKLIADPAGQSVYTITTELDASGKAELSEKGREEILWQVRAGLVEDDEFKFVSEAGWKLLLEWYGPYDGPSLGRFCYEGDRVEMVPSVYTLHIVERVRAGPVFPQAPSDSPAKPIRITCPPTTKLATFVSFVKSAIADHLDEDAAVRVWQLEVGETNGNLPDLSALRLPANLLPSLSGGLLKDDAQNLSIAELGLVNGDVLAAEIGRKSPVGGESWVVGVNEEGKAVEKTIPAMTVPTAPAPLFSKPAFFGGSGASNVASTSSNTGMQTRSQTKTESRNTKGLVGLVNLGNTCFMNSAVQCLSNTPELNEYFLSGVYREELNPDNPLGMGGQIAKAFGETIETLWRGSSSSFTPRDLKWKTGRFAPQFVGYGQHDTQEFIAFLLDGLHEDLNRIQKKPYIEKPDWKPGGGNKELAELGKECWEGYKKRNDSVIVDLFQGQLKSTLVCPECRKESITLDPFMYLTVPLPIAQIRVAKFDFVPLDPAQPPRHVKLLLPTNASWGQLKEKLALLAGCPSTNLVGIDLWQSGVYRWWRDPDLASEAGSSDLPVFYETAAPISANRKAVGIPATESTVTVPVYTFRNPDQRGARFRHDPSYDIQPFFITLTKAEASDPVAVREAITKGYSRWVKDDARDDLWVHSGSRRAARALPVVEDEEEEPVAEIHLDGDETRVVEVPPRSAELEAESSQGTDSTYLNSPLPQRNASFASISDAASMRSHKSGKLVPRGDLFKVFVSEASTSEDHSGLSLSGTFGKKEPPVAPLWRGSLKNASNAWSALESRKKQKKGMLGHLKSMVSSSYQSDEEASPPATPTGAPACVRPGEGIFCEWEQEQFEEFFEMAETSKMDMETLEDPAIAKEMERRKAGQNITLDDCLDEFSKEETLGQEDLWYCPQCKKHQAATKKLEIYQAPDILVICLKRFGSSRRLTDKLDQHVSFPMEGLDLSDRIDERKIAKSLDLNSEDMAHYGFTGGDEPIVYDLYAVDNHFGGLGGGHYTAFCRNKVDGEWYNYDDSRVSKASPDAVESRAAYLLFYRRRTSRPIGGLSRVKAEQASRAASPAPSSTDLSSAETGPVSHVLARERNSSGGSTSSTDAIGSNDDEADMDPPGPWSPLHNWADNDAAAGSAVGMRNDGDAELPGYGDTMNGNMNVNMNTPPSNGLPSPAVSDEGDVDSRNESVPDYTAIGAQIGFGNNAWGATTKSVNGGGAIERQHTTGDEGFVERNGAGAGMIQLTPPDSEDGFEKIRAARSVPALAPVAPGSVRSEKGEGQEGVEAGAGGEQVVSGERDVDEDYDMVKKEEGTDGGLP